MSNREIRIDMMKKILCALAAALVAVSVFAQSNLKVKAVLVDASTGETLPFATMSLTPQGAQKASKYALSNDEGVVNIDGVKKGTYTVKAELMGYKPYEAEVKVEATMDLGTLKLELDTQLLDAASVSAVGNPIIVKKDTIEYNASSFKTTDNDMLEDLLKKLPGVEVDSDGSVTANGKTISKITIDGKTFFLDDPSLASKNIPAKIINKVKVVEKKSDQAMFTGIDDGEDETVIDLNIMPGMMRGWFGNVMGGGGHDIQEVGMGQPARWQGAAMIGRFTDKSQISIILNGNNTNNRGFNDLAGSMMGGMRGGGGGMGRGAGGMGGNNGVTTSWMGGLNGAFTLCDGDMDLGGNYVYNGSSKVVTEWSQQDTYLEDGSAIRYVNSGPFDLQGKFSDGNIYGINNSLTQGHRIGIRLEHKFSEKTSILFQPQFNFGGGSFTEYSDNETWRRAAGSEDWTKTTSGFTSTDGRNRNWTASGFMLLRQRLNKPGRTISVNARYNFRNNEMEGYNQSISERLTNQYYESVSKNASVNTRVSYTEPLLEQLYLEVYGSYGWNRNKTLKDTYNSGAFNEALFVPGTLFIPELAFNKDGMTYDATYSNDIVNIYHNMQGGANVQYQTEKLRAQIGASYQPTITDNITNGKTYHDVAHKWSPQAMINFEPNDNTQLRLFYRGNSGQPSTSQLMPVPDNSNPLALSFGNPYLKPYFNHNVNGMFGYTNKETFLSINGNFGFGFVQNGITNAQWYDENNVQYAMPVNGGLTGNANLRFFINAPLGQSGFSISNMCNASYSSSASYIGKTDKYSALAGYYDDATAEFDYEKFHGDFFKEGHPLEFEDYFLTNKTQSLSVMERLRGTYRNDFVEINVGARTRFNKPWYTVQNAYDKMTWSNQVQGEMIWTIPCGLGIKADCRYNWYNNYQTAQEPECIINAEISQLLCKNKLTLSLKGYDLLNQARNHYITDTANYHTETLNNTLGRYIIVSLTYRFGNFNRESMGGPGRMGPGGPRGGMGPGMGPRRF